MIMHNIRLHSKHVANGIIANRYWWMIIPIIGNPNKKNAYTAKKRIAKNDCVLFSIMFRNLLSM